MILDNPGIPRLASIIDTVGITVEAGSSNIRSWNSDALQEMHCRKVFIDWTSSNTELQPNVVH